MVSQPGSGPTRPKSLCYNNTQATAFKKISEVDPVRQNPIWLTCKPLQRMCNNRMLHITTIKSSLLMFPLTPDQHHWLEVATEDEG